MAWNQAMESGRGGGEGIYFKLSYDAFPPYQGPQVGEDKEH